MITPLQCTMARAALKWSQPDLAEKSGVGLGTIVGFEKERTKPIKANLAQIQRSLESAGIEFIDNGVRLKKE